MLLFPSLALIGCFFAYPLFITLETSLTVPSGHALTLRNLGNIPVQRLLECDLAHGSAGDRHDSLFGWLGSPPGASIEKADAGAQAHSRADPDTLGHSCADWRPRFADRSVRHGLGRKIDRDHFSATDKNKLHDHGPRHLLYVALRALYDLDDTSGRGGYRPCGGRSARVLGANSVQVLLRITLPLSMPGIRAGAILTFLLAFEAFGIPLIAGGNNRPLAVEIYTQAHVYNKPEIGSALAIIMAYPALLVLALAEAAARLRRRSAKSSSGLGAM